MNIESMINDAITSGVNTTIREIRRKLVDATLVRPSFSNPFGHPEGVGAKIDEMIQLLTPAITEAESDKVYARMAGILRGNNV